MRTASFISISAAAVILAVLGQPLLAGQANPYAPPRTSDGQPDLQGIWTNATVTPLERPAEFGTKQFLTEKEAAEFAKQAVQATNADRRDLPPELDVARAYNQFWYDRGTTVVGTKRTSLIVDPPDGRIPPLTPQGQKRADDFAQMRVQHPADGPENRTLNERCIKWATAGPPMLPGPYNNNYQIVQAPGYVVILVEMIHDARIIPLDGRSHLPQNVRSWLGDSRGHWEGNTLVVETTNLRSDATYRNTAPETLHLTERFTRVDANSIQYEFTVDDPATFTRPWTASIPMTSVPGPVYEYACHEGNYAMEGILAGARAEEKKTK
jgi:hypothetical protein